MPYLLQQAALGVKDSVLTEALFLAAGGRQQLMAYAAQHQELERYLRYRLLPQEPLSKYYLYPSLDYLAKEAKRVGLDAAEYQRLLYRHRKKSADPGFAKGR